MNPPGDWEAPGLGSSMISLGTGSYLILGGWMGVVGSGGGKGQGVISVRFP